MHSTRVLALIFMSVALQGCQTTKPGCVIPREQDSHLADLQRQKDETLCEIQLRQSELDRIEAAVSERRAVGTGRQGLGYKTVAELTGKIIQLRAKVHDLDFQMAAVALASFNRLLSQAKLASQQHSELLKDPKNSAAQVGLMVTYFQSVTGGHNAGEQITRAEWEAATVACRCLAEIEPRFGPQGFLNGATIPQGQATRMLGAMRDNAKSALDTYKRMKESVDSQMQADMDAAGPGESQINQTPVPTGATSNWDAYPVAK